MCFFYCFTWLLFLVHFHFCFSTNAFTWGHFSSQFLYKDDVNVIELVYFLACKISSVNIQVIIAFISMVVINHFYIRTKSLQTLLSVKNLWCKKLKKAFYIQIQSREDRDYLVWFLSTPIVLCIGVDHSAAWTEWSVH